MDAEVSDHSARQKQAAALHEEILAKVAEYYQLQHADRTFVPGESLVHYAGRVFDEHELINGVEAVLEFQLTHGRFGREFEKKLGAFLGMREVIPVNSGSSANLIAIATLCAQQLHNGLRPGDEVITPAVTFPTPLPGASGPMPLVPTGDYDMLNILLLGSDQRPGDRAYRTDTIIVVSINRTTSEVCNGIDDSCQGAVDSVGPGQSLCQSGCVKDGSRRQAGRRVSPRQHRAC